MLEAGAEDELPAAAMRPIGPPDSEGLTDTDQISITVEEAAGTTLAYVVNRFEGNVSVVDVATNTVTTTIPVGDGPGSIAFTP